MGQPKGALPVGKETLIERLVRSATAANLTPVLVGDAAAYPHLVPDVRRIPDDPSAQGPLAGLLALLKHRPSEDVLLVACDMPAVNPQALIALRDHASKAVVVSEKDGFFEPFLARYPAGFDETLIAYVKTGRRSFQGLLRDTPTTTITFDRTCLSDWDAPLDITGTDGQGRATWCLRAATRSDEEFLWSMLHEASHAADTGEPRSKMYSTPELARYVEGWGHAGDYGVVAVYQGRCVGAAWYRHIRGYGFVAEDIPELAIATVQEWTGRGVGSAMLRALLHHGMRTLSGVSLSVRLDNPARRLYQRFGFVDVAGSALTNRVGTTSVTMLRKFTKSGEA